MGISDEQRIIKVLLAAPRQKATFSEVAAALSHVAPKWTPGFVEAKARMLNDNSEIPISVVPSDSIQYFGDEVGLTPGIYDAVQRQFPKWAKKNGYSVASALPRVQLSEHAPGRWSNPDMVFRVIRNEGSIPPEFLHSVEIERIKGFDVRSVYQAHEQGRGADFRWVLYHGTKAPDAQTRRAAKELGVGIVAMNPPNQPSQWKLHLRAQQQTVTKKAREDLRSRIRLEN